MKPLIEELPRHYQRSAPDAELQRVLSLLVEQAQADEEFTLAQLFPSTTSGWGLELWERAYGLPVDPTQSDERRRQRILAKVKGTGVTTAAKLLGIAQVFETTAELVEVSGEYRFEIWFTDTIGEIAHRQDLVDIVNELKPAHLDWAIKYRKEIETPILVGALARQGDSMILWEVDCRNDP